MNDLKFAFRQLLKNPGFAAVAVFTLALGIGATASVFRLSGYNSLTNSRDRVYCMITAKTQYNLKNAEQYFEEHLCGGDYYNEGQRVAGEWIGVGAEKLGLAGKIREW